jgi:hypothetical protein
MTSTGFAGIALDTSERTSIRERAVRELADESNSRTLRELYDKLDEPSLKERVIRVMADIGDSESKRWLRDIVAKGTESVALRERAIRSLAEQGDITYLRSVLWFVERRDLQERVVRSVAEAGGADAMAWLAGIVKDPKKSSIGARSGGSLSRGSWRADGAARVALRLRAGPHRARTLVSLLAERGDRAARDKLRAIATNDPNEDLRQRAVRKLAESR